MADFMLELKGTPDEVLAMRNVASRIEGATAYREKRITDGHYNVWYRSTEAPNDLMAAIKRRAGLTKPKSKARGKDKSPFKELSMVASNDGETWEEKPIIKDGKFVEDSGDE